MNNDILRQGAASLFLAWFPNLFLPPDTVLLYYFDRNRTSDTVLLYYFDRNRTHFRFMIFENNAYILGSQIVNISIMYS